MASRRQRPRKLREEERVVTGKRGRPIKERDLKFAGYRFTASPEGTQIHRRTIDLTAPGDYGCDPLGDGMFRMVPSGDIVDSAEKERRLRRFNRNAAQTTLSRRELESIWGKAEDYYPPEEVARVRSKWVRGREAWIDAIERGDFESAEEIEREWGDVQGTEVARRRIEGHGLQRNPLGELPPSSRFPPSASILNLVTARHYSGKPASVRDVLRYLQNNILRGWTEVGKNRRVIEGLHCEQIDMKLAGSRDSATVVLSIFSEMVGAPDRYDRSWPAVSFNVRWGD